MADYGGTSGVGALVPRYSGDNGDFTGTTIPTTGQVTGWLDEVNAIMNGILRQHGFTTPITDSDVTPALDAFANRTVSEIVMGVKGYGRFGPRQDGQQSNQSPFMMITGEFRRLVEADAFGLEQLGAERANDLAGLIDYRSTDEGGDDTAPIFQRSGFGNAFTDWDD